MDEDPWDDIVEDKEMDDIKEDFIKDDTVI